MASSGACTDIGEPIGVWGYVDAALQMESGTPRPVPRLGSPTGQPDPEGPMGQARRLPRVAHRLRELLGMSGDPEPPTSADQSTKEHMVPDAPAYAHDGFGSGRNAGLTPQWRLLDRQDEGKGTKKTARPTVREAFDRMRRKHLPSSLPPPLRRSRPELPSRYSMLEMIEEKARQIDRESRGSCQPDEEWWEGLRAVAASRVEASPKKHNGGPQVHGGVVSCDDIVTANLFWGDPLVQSGRKYRNNWQLPVVWPAEARDHISTTHGTSSSGRS